MIQQNFKGKTEPQELKKCPSGIRGLDEITGGGLPQGRPTLVCGTAGCGKTLMAMQFLIKGVEDYDEPGVFMSFEETAEELRQNVISLGWDVKALQDQKKLGIDYVHIDRSEFQETGEYNLEGLFLRLAIAIDRVQAKRVALDTLEVLFGGLDNEAIVRSELRRLFRWLKDKGVTAIITAESGENSLTRQGLEEYVSDCVIRLQQQVSDRIATRTLHIVKYRGSKHGSNEYPFLIEKDGISVVPITSIGLDHQVSTERISTGIDRLDTMLGGQGFYRGSSVLISGTAGTGKSTVAAHFAQATCRRGERCLYIAFEESPNQIIRNMRSIGLDLESCVQDGLLVFESVRPTLYGLEMHLVKFYHAIETLKPQVVIVDPISNLHYVGNDIEVKSFLMRLIDFLKTHIITSLMTSLTISSSTTLERTDIGVSSLMDTWLMLRDMETNGERNRLLYLLKSRGMEHSNQVREFRLSSSGVELIKAYLGPGGVLTGSARAVQESREQADALVRQKEIETKQRNIERKRAVIEAKIQALQADFELEKAEIERMIHKEELEEKIHRETEIKMGEMRRVEGNTDL
ncbi:circadian clock protein KaiC [Laspinema palackyanum]|uniref:circadian clock protein KaiC n=1 Tax=Laspinema palackyanum TaxID=3231601 RepID=UPI00345E00A4|nr:circadian clock protein KaiC [Laspinema sp. D2c]